MTLPQGILYVVATPIGNLQDLSPRAQTILRTVDLILAEDTRHSTVLLQAFGISTPLLAYHDHNETQTYASIIARLLAGEKIAIISDAGTPLISDPGFLLVRAAHQTDISVVTVPGPSAVIAALAISGLACDRFVFEGFLPSKVQSRREHLKTLQGERRALVFYESPHRITASLADMAAIFGPGRQATLARELTKLHETVRLDTLEGLLQWLKQDDNQRRGEFVIVVAGAPKADAENERSAEELVTKLLRYLPVSQAAAAASEISGMSKNKLYKLALRMNDEKQS